MRHCKIKAALILSILIILTMLPVTAFAEEFTDDSVLGRGELTFSEEIDTGELSGADPDRLMEEFFFDEEESLIDIITPEAPLSVKGDRLTGNDLFYYKQYRSIIKDVSAGRKTKSTKKVSLRKITGKRKFTARELGVKRIGYKKNGRWYVSKAAQKKINELVSVRNWKRVYQCLLSDLSSDSYWVDWYSKEKFINYKCLYSYNSNTLVFDKNDWIQFCLPVMPEFAKAKNYWNNYIYVADRNKIKDAKKARSNARSIVKVFDNEIPTTFAGYSAEAIDFYRLWYYCSVISELNAYDHYSANLEPEDRYWHGSWSMIYVFDGDPDTNAVCAGYARAFKYLCELSSFKSKWIDCQIVSGSAGSNDSSHMWNIVRMNDGLNYVVDPTWIDDDVNATADSAWFLRGDPYASSGSFTIEGNYRVYDDWTKAAFAPAERTLSANSYYQLTTDRPIVLKNVRSLRTYRKKGAFKVKWSKVATPLGALYIDGYQIQYSRNKNFSNAKSVKVKGYSKTTHTIRKLKRRKNYYVRIRTYAKVGNKTYYSNWSSRKRVRTK